MKIGWLAVMWLVISLFCGGVTLAEERIVDTVPVSTTLDTADDLEPLKSARQLQQALREQLEQLRKDLKKADSETARAKLEAQQIRLEAELSSATADFQYLAAGGDIAALWDTSEIEFDFQKELFGLIKPAITEIKSMTNEVRRKSELRDRVAAYRHRLELAEKGMANLDGIISKATDKGLIADLTRVHDSWEQQASLLRSKLNTAELQLQQIRNAETSITEVSTTYLKDFFQQRGLYLLQAVLAMLIVFLVSRVFKGAFERFIPGYLAQQRSFNVRLLDLSHRLLTMFLVLLAPILVFYFVEDWMLLSLGILFFIGLGWTLSKAVPRFWREIELFLNIGNVREGERICLNGLPWQVKLINVFSQLENPTAGLTQRVRISDLVDVSSRPLRRDEPWFPCKRTDWVILGDGVRGKVVGISQELVELVEQGGSRKTYLMQEFLALAPRNLSTNFRIKEVIGITYDLQAKSTTDIPRLLDACIRVSAANAGFENDLLSLRVELQSAGASSLDIAVIADFNGTQAENYERLRRMLQGWCVDACTSNGWEIPFAQLTVHRADTLVPA